MSRNSSFDKDGGEMGVAQLVQARAARIEPMAFMNPILLKPCDDHMTDLIFNGRRVTRLGPGEYMKIKKDLRSGLAKIYQRIELNYEVVALEGAGSPVEININQIDLSNMEMAKIADSPVILVADIDRGGVFASIVGTLELMNEEDRSRVKGVIINKFRGDSKSFEKGISMLEDIIKIPVLGLVPYVDIQIDDEDGASGKCRDSVDRYIEEQKDRIIEENCLGEISDQDLAHFVREREYDKLANILRSSLDINAIYNIIFNK